MGKTRKAVFKFRRKMWKAARLLYIWTFGETPKFGLLICHRCDNPTCVNPSHLFLGTHQDNMDDMVAKKRSLTGDKNPSRTQPEKLGAVGEDHPQAKLTANQVLEIRRRYNLGDISQAALAREFKVRPSTIWFIVRNKYWKRLRAESNGRKRVS